VTPVDTYHPSVQRAMEGARGDSETCTRGGEWFSTQVQVMQWSQVVQCVWDLMGCVSKNNINVVGHNALPKGVMKV
jgi:hypothetical protein